MLVIRDSQLAALRCAVLRSWAWELAVDFRRRLPARKLREPLEPSIIDAIVRAEGYGLVQKPDLVAFAELAFLVGPRFDDHPAVRNVLEDRAIRRYVVISEIFKRLGKRDWIQASRMR